MQTHFTLVEIEATKKIIKTGSDFPKFIHAIKELGVTSYETWVFDSHTEYRGSGDYQVQSGSKYEALSISDQTHEQNFARYLKIHQQGETDYLTFCKHCAETGIAKWIVDLAAMTCTYYGQSGNEVLKENIPSIADLKLT